MIPDHMGGDISELDFWTKRFCPLIEFKLLSDNHSVDYTIECIDSTKHNYHTYKNGIVISGKWHKCEAFLAKFITQVFQKLLIKQNIIFLPAACVIKKNTAILIIGEFGQGKTSVAMNFRNKKNFSILSDNYIALHKNSILGGTEYISLRKEDQKAPLYINQKIFYHENRMYCLKDNNIKQVIEKTKIIGILIPFLNDNDCNFHFLSYNESVWFLYQKMARILNGESVFFTDIISAPNFNNKRTRKQILTCTSQLLHSCHLLYASASLDNITDKSLELFEEK